MVLALAATFALTIPVWAHHSFTMFDMTKRITLAGTVTSFEWTNPHAYIEIDAPDEKGATKHWSIELGSPSILQQSGWKFSNIKAATKSRLVINPLKNGQWRISFASHFADGRVLINGPRQEPPPPHAKMNRTNRRFTSAALLAFAPAMSQCAIRHNSAGFHRRWGIYRGGPGSDPKFRPPAPRPLVLKPEYDKPYQARRAAESDAEKRGEQLANTGAQCIPYGVPTMMSVAIYPVEFIQTAKQVTIISEAFSEVRRVYLDRPQAKLKTLRRAITAVQ